MSTPSDTRPDPGYLARIFEDDQYAWARAQSVRRRFVLAEAGLLSTLVALTLWAASTDDGWTTGYPIAWCVGLLALIPLHSMLNLGIRGLYDRRAWTLDEHQRRLRDRTHAEVGHGAGALTLAAWTGGIAVVAVTGHTVLGLCLAFLLWMTAWLLPYWRLGWTLPEEDSAAA